MEDALARLGRVVAGRWTLKKLIGMGGTATVYEAEHRNGRRVALKVLHPEYASSSLVRKRFLSEGYAANKLQHEGVVNILDDGEEDSLIFLVMELLSGRSLAERLAKDGPLELSEAVRVGAAVLDVLAVAHEQGVIHRDIKPSNIFELDNGTIKVLDFGVAQVQDLARSQVTQSGFTVGTPAFMAPEQASGKLEDIDALTDVWAVGATLFQLLTGRLVHPAETANASLVLAATKAPAKIRQVRPEIPADVAKAVDRALAFSREDRWPNARAMRAALLRALPVAPENTLPADTMTIPEAETSRARRGSVRRRAVVLAACLILLVALFFLVRSRGSEQRTAGTHPSADVVATSTAVEATSTVTASAPRPAGANEPTASTAQPALDPNVRAQSSVPLLAVSSRPKPSLPSRAAARAIERAPGNPSGEDHLLDRRK